MNGIRKLFIRNTEMGLLIAASIVVAVLLVSLELGRNQVLTTDILWLIGGFIGVFTMAHIAMCFIAPYADQILLPIAALLNGIGLVVIYRLDLTTEMGLATRQVMWSFVGVALLIAVLLALKDHRSLTRYSYLLGLIGLILLALPLVWPTGNTVQSDARIWISIAGFSIQPGEFSKILLLMFFAQLLSNKRSLFNMAGHRFMGLEFPRLRDLAPILMVWAIAILIMAASNDFGPALLLFSTVLGMMFLSTGRTSWLLIGTVLVGLGGTAVYAVSDKIQTRVHNFMDPLADFHNSGYQLSQSLFALSSGGITGAGLGEGYPTLIPVVWTDFILSAIGEELGLAGLTAVLIAFALFISRIFKTSLIARDTYGKLLASGLALTITMQIFVVVGGISAMLPMTGLTTPFMSAGGSALMANYMLLAIVLRISHDARKPAVTVSGEVK
ncbi:FtsW/RodA/SpoVE family cell cycle protein [Corynebacterium caspium]|uniref:FtsW/RodA/SpoVE family cell cycle protein n=1 Tax=Corynebacterium caspium TaxID=234828 RepID=UPI00036E72D5|nr:FtsW/RodA/SpoVE family cell cycle protein [Corynebacterium caspium]WKD58477.1 Lipid II flippase FtsW [Corynebacterium caspium DSM 44850]